MLEQSLFPIIFPENHSLKSSFVRIDKSIPMLVVKIFLSLYFARCVQDLSVLRRKREICYEELRE